MLHELGFLRVEIGRGYQLLECPNLFFQLFDFDGQGIQFPLIIVAKLGWFPVLLSFGSRAFSAFDFVRVIGNGELVTAT